LVYNQLDFTGKPTKTLKTHGINGTTPSITEIYSYIYDKAQRLTATTYSLNGGSSVILASNVYDELGRLITKKRHTSTDTETYAYNIRNWLTNINSGGFTESLYYNTNPLNSNVTYNGNISYSTWTYKNAAKGYLYGYDGLNRLLSSSFKQGSSGLGDGSFDETFTYDKMGNILTLKRKKNYTQIDDLAFHYSNNEKSNQLQSVDDSGATQGQYLIKEYQNKSATQAEFAYDANGNMIKDLDRDIATIQYNVLNLPDVVQFKNGNQIKNTYNAGGQKLGTEYFTWVPGANAPVVNTGDVLNLSYLQNSVDQNGTAYIGNVEYNTRNGNSSLTAISRLYNAEGYVENLSSPQYYYYRKDHLGNNREVWLANANTTKQWTQYYPSGLPMTYNDGDNPGQQRMKYNGKEFDEMHGYDTYDYGARGMYPALDILPTVDPLCEKYPEISPYVYCHNNPVNMVDPEGLTDYSVNKEGYVYKTNPILDGVRKFFGIKDKDDKLIAVDNKNNTLVMPAGSIGEIKSYTDDKGNKAGDYFNVSNDKVAGKVDEFLSENTGVEFSRIEYNNSKESDNIISTSHEGRTDATGSLISDKLSSDGYNVSRFTHSHPEGGLPSGYVPGHLDSGDKDFTNYMNQKYPNNTTVYRVYDVPSRRYIYYNNANVYKYENKKKK